MFAFQPDEGSGTKIIFAEVERIKPTRAVFDSVSELFFWKIYGPRSIDITVF
jgi:hypothetical protein